jgi:hypothetical protein
MARNSVFSRIVSGGLSQTGPILPRPVSLFEGNFSRPMEHPDAARRQRDVEERKKNTMADRFSADHDDIGMINTLHMPGEDAPSPRSERIPAEGLPGATKMNLVAAKNGDGEIAPADFRHALSLTTTSDSGNGPTPVMIAHVRVSGAGVGSPAAWPHARDEAIPQEEMPVKPVTIEGRDSTSRMTKHAAVHRDPLLARGANVDAPRINVTIGRIEVRAIHESLPERKPLSSGPRPVSLEDHLLKRRGRNE